MPPLFVRWHPLVGPELAVPAALGVGLWILLPRVLGLPSVWFLAALVLFAWAFAVTLAMQSGHARTFSRCCQLEGYGAALTVVLDRNDDYFFDVPRIEQLGPQTFATRFPTIVRTDEQSLSLHSLTHPPGAPLLEWAMWRLTGRSELAVALLMALIGALGALPARAIARELSGEDATRTAAVLFACAPGVLLFSATSADAIFMTVTGVAVAALVREPRSDAWAGATGAVTAVGLCFTWGALALGPIGLGVGLLALRDGADTRIRILRRGAIAAAGLVAGWLAIRLLTGIDLVADFLPTATRQVSFISYRRSYWYWLAGNVVAFLFVMGVANAASLVATTVARWRERRPGMETVLLATLALASVSSVFRGETDHNWLFFMPLAIAMAASAVTEDSLRGADVSGLGQAGLTEALFYTGW